jgi:hypothetical protein
MEVMCPALEPAYTEMAAHTSMDLRTVAHELVWASKLFAARILTLSIYLLTPEDFSRPNVSPSDHGHTFICALKVLDTHWEICEVRFDYGREDMDGVAKAIFQNLATIALKRVLELGRPSLDIRRMETRSLLLSMIAERCRTRKDVYKVFGVPFFLRSGLVYSPDTYIQHAEKTSVGPLQTSQLRLRVSTSDSDIEWPSKIIAADGTQLPLVGEELRAEAKARAALFPPPLLRTLFPTAICTRLRLAYMPPLELQPINRLQQSPIIYPSIDLEDVDRKQFEKCFGSGSISFSWAAVDDKAVVPDKPEKPRNSKKPRVADDAWMPPPPPDTLWTVEISKCDVSPSALCEQLASHFPWATVRTLGLAAAFPEATASGAPSCMPPCLPPSPLPLASPLPLPTPQALPHALLPPQLAKASVHVRPRFDSLLFSCTCGEYFLAEAAFESHSASCKSKSVAPAPALARARSCSMCDFFDACPMSTCSAGGAREGVV